MTCTDFLAKLTDFFDGTVPPELMAEVEHHIAECKALRGGAGLDDQDDQHLSQPRDGGVYG